jgi:TATA-binding protein-associated factor Taf7
MTDPVQPGSGTKAPAAPGAEVDTERTADERENRNTDQPDQSAEAPRAESDETGAEQDQNGESSAQAPEATSTEPDENGESSDQAPEATSPELEHLKETIGEARHAADAALAPQRE